MSKSYKGSTCGRFPAPGECIYCGAKENLTDEHILPYGLGGNYIIDKASCIACATETAKFEQRMLRGHMWATRVKQKIQSRRPLPEKLPIAFSDDELTSSYSEINPDDYPEHMIFLHLPAPGILLGSNAGTSEDLVTIRPAIYEAQDFREKFSLLGRRYLVSKSPTVADMCRLLAKIAHASAIADRYNLPNFVPLLPNLILGRFCGVPTHLVGCISIVPDPEPRVIHRINLQVAQVNDEYYLLSCIRLFANIGAPEYHVVIGTLNTK